MLWQNNGSKTLDWVIDELQVHRCYSKTQHTRTVVRIKGSAKVREKVNYGMEYSRVMEQARRGLEEDRFRQKKGGGHAHSSCCIIGASRCARPPDQRRHWPSPWFTTHFSKQYVHSYSLRICNFLYSTFTLSTTEWTKWVITPSMHAHSGVMGLPAHWTRKAVARNIMCPTSLLS